MTEPPTTPADTTTWPAPFAGPRRDSVVPVTSSATGAIRWTQDLTPETVGARDLLVWDGHVLVVGPSVMALHGRDGGLLWERSHREKSPVAVANGLVYLETPAYFLKSVRLSNEVVLDDAPLPGISGSETFLELLWPREGDFIITTTMPDPTYDSEDDAPPPTPYLSVIRVIYGSRVGALSKNCDGTLALPALFVPEKSRCLCAADAKLISVDVDEGTDARFVSPIERPLNWSADHSGKVALAGTHHDVLTLVAIDLDGNEQWRFTDPSATDFWATGQPPVGAASGRLVALTSQRVLAFDAGQLAWQVDLRSESPRRATMLGDNAVLVTSGKNLRKLDANGQEVFVVELPDAIVTSPVVDAAGTIYVATATQLIAIA